MDRETCGIMPPRAEDIYSRADNTEWSVCILPVHHSSDFHVLQTPDGIYISWEDDFTCDCCTPEEEDRCYAYGEMSAEEVQKLLERRD